MQTNITDFTPEQLNEQYKHAVKAMIDCQKALNEAGVRGDMIASAAATAYIQVVAAIGAAMNVAQKDCIENAKQALDTLGELVTDVYADMDVVMEKMKKEGM